MKCKRTVLPLLGTAFMPGKMTDTIKEIEDEELAGIAWAEAWLFSAQPEKCVKQVEKYLKSEDVFLRVSADVLYTFANMTLENEQAIREARKDVYICLEKSFREQADMEIQAACLFASYAVSILIHIPPEKGYPPLNEYLRYLPQGQRLFATHMMAHSAYLNGEYEKGLGIVQTALAMADRLYPITFIYLKCMEATCQINLKHPKDAVKSILEAWNVAREDQCLEPFIEYYSLLQGIFEIGVKQQESKIYKELIEKVIHFGKGWRKIHNQVMKKQVTDLLTPVEFSIAMLACRGWTNQEIAEHMKLSVNTVKRYMSIILEKLQIKKRDELRNFVNQ